MSQFLDEIKTRAKALDKTIILPESDDERVIEAAKAIEREGIANVILLGSKTPKHILDQKQDFALTLYEIRKHKGLSEQQAKELIEDPLYLAMVLLKCGECDGVVAGAAHSTADVLKAALQIVKTGPTTKLASAFFVMCVPDCEYGANGTFIFADSGFNVSPDSESLAHIAVQSAKSFEKLVGGEPRVAMLSHSTFGSAKNDDADKVIEATRIAKQLEPSLAVDGELQVDAAIVPEVACSKAPESKVAGSANVFVFPDLDSGNIGYKLVQRLAKAEAYGPITQGFAAPVNDLSRGCSAADVVGVAAITAVQAS